MFKIVPKHGCKLLKMNKFFFPVKKFQLQKMAESIESVQIKRFLVEPGQFVREDDEIIEYDSDKGSTIQRIPESGKVLKYLVEIDEEYPVYQDFVEIDTDAKDDNQQQKQKIEEQPKEVKTQQEQTPNKQETKTQEKQTPKKPQENMNQQERIETREKMSKLRKTVAKRLKESQNTYASVTTFQIIDMGQVMDLRKELGEDFKKQHGMKLGIMSFFIKACAQALQERPIVNSVIDSETFEIIHRNYIDISIAVSSPKGLLVPVMRDLQNKSLAQIEYQLLELATKAKEGQISLEEMQGGNFTISNGGVFGSFLSVPIINPPQSAIMGMHNIITQPVVKDGKIVARPQMYVSLTYDHRLLDGREGAGFLKRVSDLVSEPRLLLF